MTMRNAPWALVVVLFIVLAFSRCGQSAREAEARVYRLQADSLRTVAEQLQETTVRQLATIAAIDERHAADSIRWAATVADAGRVARDAQRSGNAIADELRARVDSAGAALLADYEAEVEREREAWARAETSYREEIASYRDRLTQRDTLIATLFARVDVLEAETRALRGANELLRAEIRAQKRTGWLWKGATIGQAALLGYVAVTQ